MDKEKVYIFIIMAALAVNFVVSFHNQRTNEAEMSRLGELMAFKQQGARYTRQDGDNDFRARVEADAFLQEQIDTLHVFVADLVSRFSNANP